MCECEIQGQQGDKPTMPHFVASQQRNIDGTKKMIEVSTTKSGDFEKFSRKFIALDFYKLKENPKKSCTTSGCRCRSCFLCRNCHSLHLD